MCVCVCVCVCVSTMCVCVCVWVCVSTMCVCVCVCVCVSTVASKQRCQISAIVVSMSDIWRRECECEFESGCRGVESVQVGGGGARGGEGVGERKSK